VSGCAGARNTRGMCAQHFLKFLLYRLAPGTIGFSTLPPAGRKKVTFPRFNRHQKITFGAGVTKNIYPSQIWVFYDFFKI